MELLKKIGFLLFVIFVLFLFIWALYLPKKESTEIIKKTLEEQKQRLDLYFRGVTFQEIVGGIKYWEIKAKTSSLNKDTGIATLKDTYGTFFENGMPTLKFLSPLAVWNMNKKEIQLKDVIGFDAKSEDKVSRFLSEAKKVDITTFTLPARYQKRGEGYFFKAKKLSWRLADQKISCGGGIWLTKGEISGLGRELQADVGLQKVLLKGNPKVVLVNRDIITIEAQAFTVDSPTDTLSADGGVTLTSDHIKIKTQKINYRQRDNQIEIIKSVHITYRDILATADQALYDITKQVITLSQNTRLKRQDSIMTGDKITVSLKDKTFKISGKTKAVISEEEFQEKK
jgi:lipopolysaccharide transport protein LptA